MGEGTNLTQLQAILDGMPATTGNTVGVPPTLYYQALAETEARGQGVQTLPLATAISFLYHGQWITPQLGDG